MRLSLFSSIDCAPAAKQQRKNKKRSLKRQQRREHELASHRDAEQTSVMKPSSHEPQEVISVEQASVHADQDPAKQAEMSKQIEEIDSFDSTYNESTIHQYPREFACMGNTPAITAAVANDMTTFMSLVRDIDVTIPNYKGYTALHALAERGQADIIRTLGIEHFGHSLNAQTYDEGSTPLMLAVRAGHADTCHALACTLKANIHVVDACGYNACTHALHTMRFTGDDSIIKIILESIDDDYCRYLAAIHALGYASASGLTDLVETLIDTYGIDVNCPLQRWPNGDHATALMLAAETNQIDVVKLLTTKYSATLNFTNMCGETALLRATLTNSVEVVRYLSGLHNMKYIDLMASNWWNQTAFSLACEKRHDEMIHILSLALKEKERQYAKAKKKAQKRKGYQRRKQSRENHDPNLIKAYRMACTC